MERPAGGPARRAHRAAGPLPGGARRPGRRAARAERLRQVDPDAGRSSACRSSPAARSRCSASRPGRPRCARASATSPRRPSVYGDLTVRENLAYFAGCVGAGRRGRASASLDGGRPRPPRRRPRRPALRRPALAGLPRRRAARHPRAARARRAHRRARPGAAPRPVGRSSAGSPTTDDAAGLEPRHGRGHPLRPAAAAARRARPRRRHARPACSSAPAPPTPSRLPRPDRPAEAGARMNARGSPLATAGPRPAPAARRPPHRRADARRARACCSGCCVDLRRHAGVFDAIGAAAARRLPLHRDVPRHQRRDPARAHVRHAGAAAHRRRSARPTSCSATPWPSARWPSYRPWWQRHSRSGSCGLDVAGPAWLLVLVAVFDALLGTALGLLASALRAHRVPGRAVHAGLRAAAVPALRAARAPRPAAARCSSAVSDVLPLSYAVDAMKDGAP